MIRVVLAEDQAMMRGALSALLSLEPDIQVLATVADGESALREAHSLRPDVLVTDIEMPGLSGLDVAQRVQRFDVPCKVVILTTFARAGYLRRALDAGVAGYLIKDAPAEQLAAALRTVMAGGRVIDPQLAVGAWTEPDPLNERERQVLRQAGEGASAAQTAATLGLSAGTVRNYLSEAIGKLGASNRVEAVRIARQKGWL
jgi:two-component system response regulator DesR